MFPFIPKRTVYKVVFTDHRDGSKGVRFYYAVSAAKVQMVINSAQSTFTVDSISPAPEDELTPETKILVVI